MKTQKQEELVNSFLSELGDETRTLYHEIIMSLVELGYNPQKERLHISFKHDLHNKQMAKMGIKKGKEPLPFFSLRFSACEGYSQRFTDIVSAAITKSPSKIAHCLSNDCDYCAGTPFTHIYKHTIPGSELKAHCGAFALEIPNITTNDIPEIKKLLKEEHNYLLEHEADRT